MLECTILKYFEDVKECPSGLKSSLEEIRMRVQQFFIAGDIKLMFQHDIDETRYKYENKELTRKEAIEYLESLDDKILREVYEQNRAFEYLDAIDNKQRS